MKTQTSLTKKNEKLIYFGAYLVTALCLWGMIQTYSRFGGCDSRQYMVLSQCFTNGGSFSFLHYPQDVAGYAFPFLLFLMDKMTPFSMTADYHHRGVELISALAVVWLGSYFAERFVAGAKENNAGSLRGKILRMVAFTVLFYVFFRDLAAYPLSDLWPMVFAGVMFVCLFGFEEAKTGPGRGLWSFALGLCGYLVYNIRQSWLFFLPVVWLVFLVRNRKDKKRLSAGLICMVAGMLAAALPQMFINHQNFGTWSPMVSAPMQGFDSMFLYHLYGGTVTNRVETWVLPEWGEAVTSVNRAGQLLLSKAGVTPENFGYGTYIKLLISYFPDYVGIYMEHFVSLITPVYTQIYIQDLNSRFRFLVMLAHYGIYALVLWDIVYKFRKGIYSWKGLCNSKSFLFLAFALPALSAIPGYIEIRYGVPLILLAYLYVCYCCSFGALWRDVKKNWLSYLLPTVVVMALCVSVMGDILSAFDLQQMLLGR